MKNDDNIKLPIAHIRKMKNIAEGKTSTIDKIVLSTKATIG